MIFRKDMRSMFDIFAGHTKDPFDRILFAQAVSNKYTIVTRDSFIPAYDVATVWD